MFRIEPQLHNYERYRPLNRLRLLRVTVLREIFGKENNESVKVNRALKPVSAIIGLPTPRHFGRRGLITANRGIQTAVLSPRASDAIYGQTGHRHAQCTEFGVPTDAHGMSPWKMGWMRSLLGLMSSWLHRHGLLSLVGGVCELFAACHW